MGEALALAAALAMAVSNVLVRAAERRCATAAAAGPGGPAAAELPLPAVMWWTTAVNAAVLVPLWLAVPHPPLPRATTVWLAAAAAGLLGQYVGRLVLYDGLRRLGPGWIAAGKGTAPVLAALLAFPLTGQLPGLAGWCGLALVGLGTALASGAGELDRRRAADGLRAGLAAGGWLAASLAARGWVMGAWPDPVGGAALGALATAAVLGLRWPRPPALPSAARPAVLGSGLASAAALGLQLAALGYADVATVAALFHTEPLWALALAHRWLGGPDRVPGRMAGAAALVVAGALLV